MAETAKIKIEAEGRNASREVNAVRDSLTGLSRETIAIGSNMIQQWGGVSTALGGVAKVINAIDRSVVGMKPIDVAASRDSAKQLQNSLSTLAYQSGLTFGQLDSAVQKSAKQFGILPDEAGRAINAYAALTRDTEHLTEVTEQIGVTQQRTGLSTGELTEYFAALRRGIGTTGPELERTTEAVRMLALANHTAGGERGMIDLMESLSGQLEQIGPQTDAAKDKILALVGALSQGRTRGQARTTAGAALSALEGVDRQLLMNTIRENPYDPVTDTIKDPVDAMLKVKQSVFKRWKDPGARWRILTKTFPGGAGAALWRGDFDKAVDQAHTVQAMRDTGAIALGPMDGPLSQAERAKLQRDVRAGTGGYTFRDTIAGQRQGAAAGRAAVEYDIGKRAAALQDMKDVAWKNHENAKAGVATGFGVAEGIAGAIPGGVGRAAQAAVAAAKGAVMIVSVGKGAVESSGGERADRGVMLLERMNQNLENLPQKMVDANRRGQPVGLTDPTGQVTKDRKAATAN